MGLFTDYNLSFARFYNGSETSAGNNNAQNFGNSFPCLFDLSLSSSNPFTYFPPALNFPQIPLFNFTFPPIFPNLNFTQYTLPPIQDLSLKTPPLISNPTIGDTFIKSRPKATTNTNHSSVQPAPVRKSNIKLGGLPTFDVTLNGTTIKKFGHVNIDKLQPDMKDKLVALHKEAKKHGYTLVANDCYRSASVQAAGRKRKGNLCAPPNKSPHQYGCAFDLALYDSNGKQVDISRVKWFSDYAKNTLNLTWGQDWKSKKESWHFERKNWNKPGSDVYLAYCQNNGIKPNQNLA